MDKPIRSLGVAAGFSINNNNYHIPANKTEVSKEVPIVRVIEELQSYIESQKTSLDISVHEATGDIVVKVISDDDGKVIREVPSEEVLNHAARMEHLQGLIFDKIV